MAIVTYNDNGIIKVVKFGNYVVSTDVNPYVRFVSASARTITPKYTNSGVTLQYSINNGATWTTIASGSPTTSSTEHWFRGQATGTKSLFTSFNTTNAWAFSGSSDLKVYGNLNYLLCNTLGDKVAPTSLGSYCYANMFYGYKYLTVAPSLPATTLGTWCYYNMFNDCTSLTTAPELPATTLVNSCYSSMFGGCTSLTTAPSLPATRLADACYQNMFFGCRSLTTAPELPATTLKDACYFNMFNGCTSLTTAPSLPANPVATVDCYRSMFEGCSSLTTVPHLRATVLANTCYRNMFKGCSSLKVSATNTGSYTYAWRIPRAGTIEEIATNWSYDILRGTGGTYTGDLNINTTYYVVNKPV